MTTDYPPLASPLPPVTLRGAFATLEPLAAYHAAEAREAVADGLSLKEAMAHVRGKMDPKFAHVFIYEHCLPFDVTRAVDEAQGIKHPRIWTAERDKEMWHALQS